MPIPHLQPLLHLVQLRLNLPRHLPLCLLLPQLSLTHQLPQVICCFRFEPEQCPSLKLFVWSHAYPQTCCMCSCFAMGGDESVTNRLFCQSFRNVHHGFGMA